MKIHAPCSKTVISRRHQQSIKPSLGTFWKPMQLYRSYAHEVGLETSPEISRREKKSQSLKIKCNLIEDEAQQLNLLSLQECRLPLAPIPCLPPLPPCPGSKCSGLLGAPGTCLFFLGSSCPFCQDHLPRFFTQLAPSALQLSTSITPTAWSRHPVIILYPRTSFISLKTLMAICILKFMIHRSHWSVVL